MGEGRRSARWGAQTSPQFEVLVGTLGGLDARAGGGCDQGPAAMAPVSSGRTAGWRHSTRSPVVDEAAEVHRRSAPHAVKVAGGSTADVYEQDLDDSDYAIELLETVMGCTLAEAHDVFAKRRVFVAKASRSAETPAESGVEDFL